MSLQLKQIIISVVDVTGQPLAGAFVTVEWGTAPTPEITQLTDTTGCVHLAFPPGRFRVRAAAKGYGDETVEVDTLHVSGDTVIRLRRQ